MKDLEPTSKAETFLEERRKNLSSTTMVLKKEIVEDETHFGPDLANRHEKTMHSIFVPKIFLRAMDVFFPAFVQKSLGFGRRLQIFKVSLCVLITSTPPETAKGTMDRLSRRDLWTAKRSFRGAVTFSVKLIRAPGRSLPGRHAPGSPEVSSHEDQTGAYPDFSIHKSQV